MYEGRLVRRDGSEPGTAAEEFRTALKRRRRAVCGEDIEGLGIKVAKMVEVEG